MICGRPLPALAHLRYAMYTVEYIYQKAGLAPGAVVEVWVASELR
jgi:hypothetical protein